MNGSYDLALGAVIGYMVAMPDTLRNFGVALLVGLGVYISAALYDLAVVGYRAARRRIAAKH